MQQQVDADFSNEIIFCDYAHFHLNGCVNRLNFHVCDSENPRVVVEKQMYQQRVTIFCGFWAGGIIRPFSSKMWLTQGIIR